jgi:serine/threonine protein kinase
MSASQIIPQSQKNDIQHCTRCGMVLPPTAAFCGKCGERLEKPTPHTKGMFFIDRHVNLERYRITSLVRRAPYVQLSLAMDTQQQRPVAIRDINIQQIDTSSRSRIFKELQQEYDLLRRQKSKDVLPLIASFHAQNHLYSISAWPLTTGTSPVATSKHGQAPHIYTLEDLLQSGIGLPDEQIALNWILHLTNAIEHLHRNHIVIGTLDPSTILVKQKDYSGQPTLFPSWTLPTVQSQLQQALYTANASSLSHITADKTAFFSPEAKHGQPEIRSDIYSIGAILYLLLTGIAPTEQSRTTSQQLRSPREINPRVQHTLATIILKALSRKPSARFQSVNEFAAVLLEQQGQNKVSQRPSHAFLGHNRSAEKAGLKLPETNFTSDKDNNTTEQGKAAQANLETNGSTISIAPIPHQLARHYSSRINTHQPGQEPSNSDYEESIVETGYSEQTMQPTKEQTQQPQTEDPATVVQVVSGLENGTALQNKSDNTASPNEDEPNMDDQQLSPQTDTEETPGDQTVVVDEEEGEQNQPESTVDSLERNEHIPLREQAQPNSSTNEISTDSKNTLSSGSNNTDLALSPSPDEIPTDSENTLPSGSNHADLTLSPSPDEIPTDSENTLPSGSNHAGLTLSPSPSKVLQQDKRDLTAPTKAFSALFERIKRFVISGQPRINNAVAMIETPMRVQPNQNYTIRIHLMGRNEPKHVPDAAILGGLGSLIQGERVHIEVRSALYHNYAYIVQQTDVEVPAPNFAAEVTIPMRSIADNSGTKRERLHIFFTDQKHNPLYEKPFVIELFISNLVQSGHEGHNVLAIPL